MKLAELREILDGPLLLGLDEPEVCIVWGVLRVPIASVEARHYPTEGGVVRVCFIAEALD